METEKKTVVVIFQENQRFGKEKTQYWPDKRDQATEISGEWRL